jgi:hypothetical protein
MNTVYFSICAKNYLSQAYALGNSLKLYAPNDEFFIVLVDEIDDIEISSEFKHLSPKQILQIDVTELAFKYDVIEFSTSVKPFFIDYFFKNGYDNVIYLDPDMVVYNKLDYLTEQLNSFDFIITPHIRKPYLNYKGSTPEEEILFVGIYNLGFFAIKKSMNGLHFIEWWKNKLLNQCYADKNDALHVDQKWIDFLPSFYPSKVLIEKSPTINMASWSIHEVFFSKIGNKYFVDDCPLLIFHFSGIDILDENCINKKQTLFNLTNKTEYKELFTEYKNIVLSNKYDYYKNQKYKYDYFSNGVYIDTYVRRIYRLAVKETFTFDLNLFEVDPRNSVYNFLYKKKLLIGENAPKYYRLKSAYNNAENKIQTLEKGLLILKKIIGIKYYSFLMRFFAKYSRFENQPFLLK